MKHSFKKLMALLLATLMVMSAFSTIGAVAADSVCAHGTWEKWAVNGETTVAPTCTTPGYTWYRCTNPDCGEVEARDFVPKLDHNWQWTATSAEDVACGDLYAIYLGCTRCDAVKQWGPDKVDQNDPFNGYKTHNYTTYEIITNPTCMEHGELELVCANEDHAGSDCPRISVLIQRLNGNKGEHKFDKLVAKAEETCTTDGWELYECSLCYLITGVDALGEDAATETKIRPKLNHDLYKGDTQNHNYVADNSCVVKCERKGCGHTETIHAASKFAKNRKVKGSEPGPLSCYTADYCGRCGYEGEKTAAHTPDDSTHTRVDAVNHMCYTVYTCEDCKFVYEVAATYEGGHSGLKIQQTIAPTCTTFGTITWVCVDCGGHGVEMIPIRQHDLDYVDGNATKRVVTADCETAGGVYITCGYSDCNYEAIEEGSFVPARGHDKVLDKITPATCISPEIKTYKCNYGCGKVYAPEYVGTPIPNAHPSECYEVTTAPTCTTQGVATLYCTLCSAKDTWIEYTDKNAKDDAGNALYPNFDFNKLLAYEHKFTNAHVSLLLTVAPNTDTNPDNNLTVGSSALYNYAKKEPTCVEDGYVKGSCYICNVKIEETLEKGHSSEGGYHDQHAVDPEWYLGGYLTYDGNGDVNGSYLRLPNGDHEALEWYYCASCKTNWTAPGEMGAHTGWEAIEEGVTEDVVFVEEEPATCGKTGTYAHWLIPCTKTFYEIKKVVALPIRDNDLNIVGYKFDLDNDGNPDGTIGEGAYEKWAVDADGYVRDENGYFEWYLVEVECHHVSTIYVGKDGKPILDDNGAYITDGTIAALVHDWDVVDGDGEPAPILDGYKEAATVDCVNDGMIKHWICGNCNTDKFGGTDTNGDGKLTHDDFVIGKLGHDKYDVAAKASTCTEDGYNKHKACRRCDWTEGKVVDPKDGHVKLAKKDWTQSNYCDCSIKAPTCTEAGVGYGSICPVCHECAGNHEVIDALGHQTINLTTNNAPTCTAPYFTITFCAICGHFDECAKKAETTFEEETPVCECDKVFNAYNAAILGGMDPAVIHTISIADIVAACGENHNINWVEDIYVEYYFTGEYNKVFKDMYTDKEYDALYDAAVEALSAADTGITLDLVIYDANGLNGKVVASVPFVYSADEENPTVAYFNYDKLLAEGTKYNVVVNVSEVDAKSYLGKNITWILQLVTASIDVNYDVVTGCRVIDDFKYWTEHTIQEGLKMPNLALINDAEALAFFAKKLNRTVPADLTSKAGIAAATAIVNDFFASYSLAYTCFGYVQYTGCTVPGCGHVVEGSVIEIAGEGHVIADHKNAETPVTNDTLECSVCKLDVDAHENMYVITAKPSYVELAQGNKAATHHVVTNYALKACTECEYRGIVVTSVNEAKHTFTNGTIITDTPASLTAAGVGHINCDQAGCPATKTVEIPQLSGTFLDLEIDNANKAGAGYTDSSIVAVTVKLSAADIAIWGINFKLTYDARYVEYLDGEEVWLSENFKYGNSAVDVENTFAANHTGAKTNWVIVTAQAPNGADSKTQNIVVSGEEAFVTLYFKVNCAEKINGVLFGFDADGDGKNDVDVINNGFVQEVDKNGKPVFKADGVTPKYIPQKVTTTATGASIAVKKYMDHTGEGTVDLLDCLAAYQIYSGEILVEGDYSVTIDVNKDGVVDLVDFMAIYDYISGKISYEDIRNLKA